MFLLLLLPQVAAAALGFQQVILDNSYIAYERDVGDIDGDGDNDLVTIQEGDTSLQVFRAPTWTRSTLINFSGTYRYPRADDFKVADMDGDGDLDMVTGLGDHPAGNTVQAVWCENLGGGSGFSPRIIGTTLAYVKDIVVADFDRDGRLDVAMRMDSATQLWLRNSNGSWSEVVLSHAAHEGLEAGDLDMDGDPDLILNGFWFATPNTPAAARVAANYTQRVIDSAWYNQGGDWTADSCKVMVGDFDGNGVNDVAFSHSERPGYSVAWYRSSNPNGAGPWSKNSVAIVDYCHTLQAADFDLDGDVDLLVGGMTQSQHRGLKLMLNDGTGTSWSQFVVQSDGSYSAELGDIDRDGDLDIVGIRNWDSPPTYIYRNNASSGGGDTTRPTLTSVTAGSANSVQVLFSEPVTTASAQTPANYSINNGVTISSAVLGADTRTVTLTTSTLAGGNYTLTVNNVTDRASPPNTIAPNSQANFSFAPGDTTPPTAPPNFTATATSSTTVQLTWQPASDNVGVTQYQVSRNGTSLATLPSTQSSYQDSGLNPATTYNFSVVARDAAGNSSPPATTSATTSADGGSTAVVRVNAGGGAFVDTAGNNWSADFGFNNGNINTEFAPIAGTANDTLYQSERVSTTLIYSFILPNGNYTVNLHFAEIWNGAFAVGARVSDVFVEGQLRIDNLDVYSQVGANAALVISLPVTVADGQLNISFGQVVQYPDISAIEVLGAGTSSDTTRPTITSVTAGSANSVQVLFSEPVTTASAQTPANYSINNGVTISSAVLGADTRTVTLTTSTLAGGNYTLTVNNVTDRANPPNTIAADSQASFTFTLSDTTPPTITSVAAINANNVQVQFSEPVATASAQTTGNYSINNGATIFTAVLGTDTRTVTLTTSALAGGSYTLTINNVIDRANPPNTIAPNSQASFVFNPPSTGGIAFGSATSKVETDNNNTASLTFGQGALVNGYIVLGISMYDPVQSSTITAASYDGMPMTLLGTAQSVSAYTEIYLFGLAVGNKAAGTYSVSLAASTGVDQLAFGVASFSGVRQTASTGPFASATGWSTAPLVNVSSEPGDLVVDILGHDSGSSSTGANQTQNWKQEDSTDRSDGVSTREPATGATTTMSHTKSVSAPWSIGVIALHVAASSSQAASLAMDTGTAGANENSQSPSSYNQWRQFHFTSAELANPFVSGDTSDPDADQLVNLMEYALGLDPQTRDDERRPTARIENGVLILTYTRNKSATDVALHLEAGNQIGHWSSSGLTQQIVSDDGVVQTIEVIDLAPTNATESRFLRVKVTFR